MRRVLAYVGERHLMRAPGTLGLVAIDLLRPGPALGRAQHDHRPARQVGLAALPRVPLDLADLRDGFLERGGHGLVHRVGVVALHEVRRVAVTVEQRLQPVVAQAGKDRRIGDLVTVEVQDRQHRSVADRTDELVGVPGGGKRSGLGLAVANHAGDDELGIVEAGAIGVRQAVAEFAALMDGPGRLRGDVGSDVAGEGELLEELLQSGRVRALVRVHLGVRAFQIRRTEHARRAVPGAGHEDHVEIVALDEAIEVRPDEGQRRARAPMPEQAVLDVFDLQRLLEQRVVAQINHAHREVIAGAPPGIDEREFLGGERLIGGGTESCGLGHRRLSLQSGERKLRAFRGSPSGQRPVIVWSELSERRSGDRTRRSLPNFV